MYIDLEGSGLCCEGSLSILTLLIDTGIPTRRVYLVDVHVLGAQAFDTSGVKRKTLKDILQDEKIPKVFFDVRNDSNALFAHFSVALQGVEDVQLMESATRRTTASRKFLIGLARCVEENVSISLGGSDLASWKQAKEKGKQLFKAEHGGSYEVFNQRPIPEDIISYCVGDIRYLPELRDRFWKTQTSRWRDLVHQKSMKRVSASQKSDYQPHSIGLWISGTTYLLTITSTRLSTHMKTGTMIGTMIMKIGTMIRATMIMKTGRGQTGKALHHDSQLVDHGKN